MNKITIDLTGLKNKEQVLAKLGDTFELGGPKSNHPVSLQKKNGWGMNWDAFNDSLVYLDTGGIWGTSKKFELPLRIIFENSHELQENDEESFRTLKEILNNPNYKINFEFH